MFCPMCGVKLIEITKPNDKNDDNEYDSKDYLKVELDTYSESNNAIEYKCDGCKCFGDGFPIVKHHPLRGYKSAPGDSWSLTWLK